MLESKRERDYICFPVIVQELQLDKEKTKLLRGSVNTVVEENSGTMFPS